MNQRGFGKVREGFVTSNRMQKTVVVSVERTVLHSQYKKYLKRKTKVKAHDKKDECRIGDRVLIVECRPMSREVRWRVRDILERGVAVEGDGPETSTASPSL
jgi:small subunit ribosomal protein S17